MILTIVLCALFAVLGYFVGFNRGANEQLMSASHWFRVLTNDSKDKQDRVRKFKLEADILRRK
jgi:hypothetical protein